MFSTMGGEIARRRVIGFKIIAEIEADSVAAIYVDERTLLVKSQRRRLAGQPASC